MPRTIIIGGSLPASPDKLFDMYLDPAEHAEFTGLPVTIEPHAGGAFSAFDGMLSGKILHIEPKTLHRSNLAVGKLAAYGAWTQVLTLSFWPAQDGARIELVHVNVPEEDFAGVSQGWEKYYWTPWHDYLIGKTHAS